MIKKKSEMQIDMSVVDETICDWTSATLKLFSCYLVPKRTVKKLTSLYLNAIKTSHKCNF